MLLRTKIRKFQLGASLNQAQNAYAPIDIRWKEFDLSGFKQSPLNIPKGPGSTGSGSTSTSDDGLPSDVEYVNTQMSNAKEKLRTRLSASDAKDYTNTTEYKNDMAEINKWAQAKASMLKARADDYKTTKTRLQKAAGDDLAIFNGQGLAMDNTDGQYKIVSADDILTERTQAGKGLAPRYTPANVSTALQLRLSDPEFSGFNEGKGDKLEKILYSVSDTETVNKEMTDLFSKAGSINESNSTFVNNKTGASTSVSDLIKNLNAVTQTSARGFKTNEPNLIDAINVFKQNVSPVHLDALRNNAIAKFIQFNGSKQVNTADANDWVDSQVDAAIANRAKVFLTKATSSKSGTSTSGGGTGGMDLSKRHLATNKVKFAEINPGEPMTMETGYEDATDLTDHMSKFNVMGKVYATRKDIKENIKEGAGGTAVKPGTAYTLDTNDYVSRLAGGDLQNNLFLADDSSTPVNDLNDKNGLSTSIVNVTPSGGQMKIMHSMPYRVDPKTGKYSIAWKDLGKAMKWGEKVKELTTDKYKELGLDPAKEPLSRDIREEIMKAASKATGFSGNEDAEVKIGEVAMIPILVASKPPTMDSNIGEVLSSNITPQEEQEIRKHRTMWEHYLGGHKLYKTFAFTVLNSNPEATLDPEYYGKADKMPSVPVDQILGIIANNHRLNRHGFDFSDVAMKASTSDLSQAESNQ